MRPLRSTTILLSIALATATGCSRAISEFRDDLRTEKRRERDAEACGEGRGRVNMGTWKQRVQDFQGRQFKDRGSFQNAKQDLLGDLADERERACSWEAPQVEYLMAAVRSERF